MRGPRERDGLLLPVRHPAEDLRDRLPAGRRRRTRTPRSILLRPARLGSAPGQLHRHREGRRAAVTLVPAGAPGHECRRPPDAPVLERHDVRVPDAAARDEELPGDASRPDVPDGRAPAAGIRAGAGRALGHLGVGIQPHRPPRQLPVPRVRRARPRAQAGARRRPGGGPLCHRARGDGRPARGRGEPPAAGARGPRRPLRLLRVDRLHAAQDVRGRQRATAARNPRRGGEGLPGPPPGHEPRVLRQHGHAGPDGGPVPPRRPGPGHRAAAAGARAAAGAHHRAPPGGSDPGVRAVLVALGPPLPLAPHALPPRPLPFQRRLYRHRHQRRRRPQLVPGPGGHPGA